MPALFADTFYFIALLDASDASHPQAVAWARQRGVSFITTDYVLVELGDAFHAPGQREEFVVFQDAVRGRILTLLRFVTPSPRDEGAGSGPGRGVYRDRRPSSPQPSPPSEGGEGASGRGGRGGHSSVKMRPGERDGILRP